MKERTKMAQTIKARAVAFAKAEILHSTDWQQVQDALSNHPEFGPWLGDEIGDYQNLIREAETSLGSKIPDRYSN
jgi:hypothetical protein